MARKGYIPSDKIKSGDKTDEPMRTRGWQYWHQLFNPRQLLSKGLLQDVAHKFSSDPKELTMITLSINKLSDWDSKLCLWINAGVNENLSLTFYNQALNTLFNYGSKGFAKNIDYWNFTINNSKINSKFEVNISDARTLQQVCDFWITDPPYADAINYHELSEFFLAWDKPLLKKLFQNGTPIVSVH